jgi:hypothetical protein
LLLKSAVGFGPYVAPLPVIAVTTLETSEETAPATEPAAVPAAPASAPDQTGAVREQEPAREQETAAAPAGVGTEPVSSGQAAEPAKEPDGELKGAVSPQSDENENRPDAGGDTEAAGESEAANTSGGEREVLAEKVIVPESALRKDQDRVAPSLPSAERAFMIIEQGSTGSDDLRLAGSAQWRLEGSGAEAVVTVTVQIPEREALVGFVMRRNNDDSLPASHMVDISYQGGDNKDGPIINVPGFMVRVEDSETPVPVRSAGALIMPGQYLLGLSGNEDDQAHNLLLLKTAQWLEIPAMFESKRRLVVVIEVGPSGTAALNGALAQWSEAGAGKTQEKAGE